VDDDGNRQTGKGGTMTRLDSVERAVADIAAGKAVVVIDDEDREKNEVKNNM